MKAFGSLANSDIVRGQPQQGASIVILTVFKFRFKISTIAVSQFLAAFFGFFTNAAAIYGRIAPAGTNLGNNIRNSTVLDASSHNLTAVNLQSLYNSFDLAIRQVMPHYYALGSDLKKVENAF